MTLPVCKLSDVPRHAQLSTEQPSPGISTYRRGLQRYGATRVRWSTVSAAVFARSHESRNPSPVAEQFPRVQKKSDTAQRPASARSAAFRPHHETILAPKVATRHTPAPQPRSPCLERHNSRTLASSLAD